MSVAIWFYELFGTFCYFLLWFYQWRRAVYCCDIDAIKVDARSKPLLFGMWFVFQPLLQLPNGYSYLKSDRKMRCDDSWKVHIRIQEADELITWLKTYQEISGSTWRVLKTYPRDGTRYSFKVNRSFRVTWGFYWCPIAFPSLSTLHLLSTLVRCLELFAQWDKVYLVFSSQSRCLAGFIALYIQDSSNKFFLPFKFIFVLLAKAGMFIYLQ